MERSFSDNVEGVFVIVVVGGVGVVTVVGSVMVDVATIISEAEDDETVVLFSISVPSRFLGSTDLGTPGKFVKCCFNSDGKG